MNTRPLPELSNLLDSDVLTCFLIFWLYHTQSIIQSAGRQRNTGAQSISSWQTFVFTSKVGRKKKVGEREHLTIPCLQLPKLLQGFGLVSLKYPKENLSEKQRELHRFIAKQDPTSGTGRAVWGFKCRVSACTAAFKPAYALAGFLFSCIAVKTFSMWTSFSAACSASTCTILHVLRGMVGFLKNRAKWTHLVN